MTELLSKEDIAIAKKTMETALRAGASAVRVSLNKTITDLCGTLDGELDKVSHSLDRSLGISIFCDGKFGTFSTNRLSGTDMDSFILSAVETVRMMEPDSCRSLPAPGRTAANALTGNELDLLDADFGLFGGKERTETALSASVWDRKGTVEKGFILKSEEIEYSENIYDSVLMDSAGLFARHSETSFDIGCQVTLETPDGGMYSSYWWNSSPRRKDLLPTIEGCSAKAVEKAAAQIGAAHSDGGKFNMVVDTECASRLLSPVLSALGGYSIQQKNSFLEGKAGEKVFSDNFTVTDRPFEKGRTGSKLFDSEGVATKEWTVIENGVVNGYFINTYIAAKTGLVPTCEDAARPCLKPFGGCITRDDVLQKMGSGILVTGFNGGNSNTSTGDFSYGIEGFIFEDGKIVKPVREMLVTGNFISLWKSLAAVAEDSRPCMSKVVPTIAFTNVDFR